MRLRHRAALRDRRSGQALPEFALVLPILLVLLFGTIQLGILLGGNNALINSVREAARYGSVCIGPVASCGPATATYARDKILAAGFGYVSSGSSPRGQVRYQAYQEPPGNGRWNVRMQVTACVDGILFVPFIGRIIHPVDPDHFPLRSAETFRVEGSPSGSASTDSNIPSDGSWGPAFTFGGGGCS